MDQIRSYFLKRDEARKAWTDPSCVQRRQYIDEEVIGRCIEGFVEPCSAVTGLTSGVSVDGPLDR